MMSSSSSHPSLWRCSYAKLRFFNRIRLFLRSKSSGKRNSLVSTEYPSSRIDVIPSKEVALYQIEKESSWSDQVDSSEALQRAVKNLHFGSCEEKEKAVEVIERLAKECGKVKKLMVELGVIPSLVKMIASELAGGRIFAAKVLIELANDRFTNKTLMVESGLLSKLPKKVEAIDECTRHEFAKLMLSLSSLAKTQGVMISLDIVVLFVVRILESTSSIETNSCCIETLYNFSKVVDNEALVRNGVVPALLKACTSKQVSEKALAALGNIVVSLKGKKEMEGSPLMPKSLIDVLRWEDKPECQELSAYILMVLAHQSASQREKMGRSGIVSVLLELALMGSPIAQKRALKMLEVFKDEKQAKMGPHSGPQTGRVSMGSPVNRKVGEEGKKMMKNLVRQSLYQNMEIITQRAREGNSSKLKAFLMTTNSTSLPY